MSASPSHARSRLPGFEVLMLALFFGSGAGALVYEVVWSRLLTYTFGGSAFAIATVLAAYMAGLALGSAWFGRRIDRGGHPMLVYGALELGIGAWAVVLPAILGGLDHAYVFLYRDFHLDGYGLALVRFALCFAVLLVPTTLMGGTLPVLGKLLLIRSETLGTRASLLYGANTAGAVLGVAGAGFLLIPAVGMRATTWVAVAVNVVIALAAAAASRRVPYVTPLSKTPPGAPAAPPIEAGEARLRNTVLLVYAASGFAALAYEVAWTKTLSLLLGTSTYAFTSMLTTFLLGLALGSFLFGRLADRLVRTEGLLGVVQLGIPLFALLSIPALERVPQLYVNGFPALRDSWVSLVAFRILLAGMVMFVPTLLMGATFPLAARAYARPSALGTSLGRLYAFNTVGAIFGSFLAGFVLVPFLGRQQTIVAASAVNLIAAVGLLTAVRWGRVPRPLRAAAIVTAAALVPVTLIAVQPWNPKVISSGAYYYADRMAKYPSVKECVDEQQLLFYKESTEAVVSVVQSQDVTSLRINGKVDASSEGDMVTQKLTGHLPTLYFHGRPERCLVIGLASGSSVGALLSHDDVERMDVVELIKDVADAARYFDPYNGACLQDPRTHLVINDGRNQLKLSPERYQIIASVPTNPYVAGVGSLFTREYFSLIKKHLLPGGIFCQWFQLYHMREQDLRAVLGTFADAFPYLHLWSGGEGDLFLIGSESPLELRRSELEAGLTGRAAADLQRADVLPLPNLLAYFVTDRDGVLEFVGDDARRVTDDNLLLEYNIPRYMFTTRLIPSALVFSDVAKSPLTALAEPPDSTLAAAVAAYSQARRLARTAIADPGHLPAGMTPGEALRAAHDAAPYERISRHWLASEENDAAIQDLEDGRPEEALAKLQEVVRFGDGAERSLAWMNLGFLRFQAGDLDSAGTLWEKAVKLRPASPTANYNLGILAGVEGDHAEAAAYFGAALKYSPESADTRSWYAFHEAMAGGDLDACLTLARRAVEESPSANNLVNLGAVLVLKSAWSEAAATLHRALDADPNHLEGRLQLAAAEVGLGDPEAARRALAPVAANPDDPERARRAQEMLDSL